MRLMTHKILLYLCSISEKNSTLISKGGFLLYTYTISMYDSFALWINNRVNNRIECMTNCTLSVDMEISRLVICAGKRHGSKCRSVPCFGASHRSQSATEHHHSATGSQQNQLGRIHSAWGLDTIQKEGQPSSWRVKTSECSASQDKGSQ